MKLVVDNQIPFIRGILEPFALISYLPGAAIRKENLTDADGLIIRTRTKCTRELLQGTPVQIIATATIGYDHIDTEWCEATGIQWTNAPGCNSGSVAQYVAAALAAITNEKQLGLKDKTLGIIGVGHVGSKVEHLAKALGMNVLLNDPPRARSESLPGFADLDTLLKHSDIVTLHVPLNRTGPDKTLHLVDYQFLNKLKPNAILINTARGEVIEEQAVLDWIAGNNGRVSEAIPESNHGTLIIDTWPDEPHINPELLAKAWIGTPHIAGYSLDGKLNATILAATAMAKHFGFTLDRLPSIDQPSPVSGLGLASSVYDHILETYDILADDRRLRESPELFENLRNNYPPRREFQAWEIDSFPSGEIGHMLQALGFGPTT
ncbi:MAG: 4-phosphoerythronate dehydrogenase [Bacteroidales bacterium]|nr:4-phosphoerythronate dehydrogenase [Bacteroidales bacterium]